MPCDSAGAGLIALGALRRRLELSTANDLAAHYSRFAALKSVAGQQPAIRHRYRTGRFSFDGVDTQGNTWLKHDSKDEYRMVVLPTNATEWQFEGEAPVVTSVEAEIPHAHIYHELVRDGGPIHLPNLRMTDSALCLAGRNAGESVTKQGLEDISFQLGAQVASLRSLLTIQGWSRGSASRLTFHNVRTGIRDREVGSPLTVVADGHAAFLDIADQPAFYNSDIIGVISRAVEREELERLGAKVASFEQWYVPESYMPCVPGVKHPRGMELLLFARQ